MLTTYARDLAREAPPLARIARAPASKAPSRTNRVRDRARMAPSRGRFARVPVLERATLTRAACSRTREVPPFAPMSRSVARVSSGPRSQRCGPRRERDDPPRGPRGQGSGATSRRSQRRGLSIEPRSDLGVSRDRAFPSLQSSRLRHGSTRTARDRPCTACEQARSAIAERPRASGQPGDADRPRTCRRLPWPRPRLRRAWAGSRRRACRGTSSTR